MTPVDDVSVSVMEFVFDMEEAGLVVPEGLESPSRSVRVAPGTDSLVVSLPNPEYFETLTEGDQPHFRNIITTEDGQEWLVVDEVAGSDSEAEQEQSVVAGCPAFNIIMLQGKSEGDSAATENCSTEGASVAAEPPAVAEDVNCDGMVGDSVVAGASADANNNIVQNPEGVEVSVVAGASADANVIKEADAEEGPVSKRHRPGSTCVLCRGDGIPNLRRHLEEMHLPWFFDPATACWTCHQSTSSLCFVRKDHLSKEGHGEDSMFLTDLQLHSWALWVTGALQFFRGAWKVDSLEDLRQEVVRRDLAPKDCSFMPGREVLLGFLDSHLNQFRPPVHLVSPPNTVSAVLHWRTFSNMLATVSPMAQEWLRQPSFMGTYSHIISIIPPLPWPSHPAGFDSHCHIEKVVKNLTLPGFAALRESVSEGRELSGIVSNFVFPNDWPRHREYEECREVHFSFGVHPRAIGQKWTVSKLEALLRHPKSVAAGEMGLTLPADNVDEQKALLIRQLKLAEKLRIPVIIHGQGESAHDQMIPILRRHLSENRKVLVHCFEGDEELVARYSRAFRNVVFSIGGLIYHGSPALLQAIRKMSLDQIVLETDAPFLAPPGVPFHRNHPWTVFRVAHEVAKVRNYPDRVVLECARRNAEWFYHL